MVRYPKNDLTSLIERAAEINRTTGHRSAPVESGPQPSVRSADYGKDVAVAPLSAEEKAELDFKAAQLGILPPTEGDDAQYASLEEAIAAGQPVEQVKADAVIIDPYPPTFTSPYMKPGRFIPVNPTPSVPRLPDFTKTQGIDLIRNVVYVDDMEFPIPESDALAHKQYVMEIVRENIMAQFEAALAQFRLSATVRAEERKDGETASVPDMQDQRQGTLFPVRNKTINEADSGMQDMCDTATE